MAGRLYSRQTLMPTFRYMPFMVEQHTVLFHSLNVQLTFTINRDTLSDFIREIDDDNQFH